MYFGCSFACILNMPLFKDTVYYSKNLMSLSKIKEKCMIGKTGDPDNFQGCLSSQHIFVCSLQSIMKRVLIQREARGICQKSQCKMFHTTGKKVIYIC